MRRGARESEKGERGNVWVQSKEITTPSLFDESLKIYIYRIYTAKVASFILTQLLATFAPTGLIEVLQLIRRRLAKSTLRVFLCCSLWNWLVWKWFFERAAALADHSILIVVAVFVVVVALTFDAYFGDCTIWCWQRKSINRKRIRWGS